jgi:hypothetical protein
MEGLARPSAVIGAHLWRKSQRDTNQRSIRQPLADYQEALADVGESSNDVAADTMIKADFELM